MVDLGVDAAAAPGQAVDQVHLPQGTAPVQPALVQAGHLLAQLLIVARRGQGELPDVMVQVHLALVGPVRVVQAEGHVDQALA